MKRRSWKSRRDKVLKAEGFFPFERYGRRDKRGRLRGLINEAFRNIKWFRRVRRQRASELRTFQEMAVANHWSQAMFRRAWIEHIQGKYKDNNWLLVDGTPDVWLMFRALRAEAIRRGEWIETPPKRGSKRRKIVGLSGELIRIDKGQAREQAARYREKKKLERAGSR